MSPDLCRVPCSCATGGPTACELFMQGLHGDAREAVKVAVVGQHSVDSVLTAQGDDDRAGHQSATCLGVAEDGAEQLPMPGAWIEL
jgi:hypothetical protein